MVPSSKASMIKAFAVATATYRSSGSISQSCMPLKRTGGKQSVISGILNTVTRPSVHPATRYRPWGLNRATFYGFVSIDDRVAI